MSWKTISTHLPGFILFLWINYHDITIHLIAQYYLHFLLMLNGISLLCTCCFQWQSSFYLSIQPSLSHSMLFYLVLKFPIWKPEWRFWTFQWQIWYSVHRDSMRNVSDAGAKRLVLSSKTERVISLDRLCNRMRIREPTWPGTSLTARPDYAAKVTSHARDKPGHNERNAFRGNWLIRNSCRIATYLISRL